MSRESRAEEHAACELRAEMASEKSKMHLANEAAPTTHVARYLQFSIFEGVEATDARRSRCSP